MNYHIYETYMNLMVGPTLPNYYSRKKSYIFDKYFKCAYDIFDFQLNIMKKKYNKYKYDKTHKNYKFFSKEKKELISNLKNNIQNTIIYDLEHKIKYIDKFFLAVIYSDIVYVYWKLRLCLWI